MNVHNNKNNGFTSQSLRVMQLVWLLWRNNSREKIVLVINMIILLQTPRANQLHAHRRFNIENRYKSHHLVKRMRSQNLGIFLFHLITAYLSQHRERLKVIRIGIWLKMQNVLKKRIKKAFSKNKSNLLERRSIVRITSAIQQRRSMANPSRFQKV